MSRDLLIFANLSAGSLLRMGGERALARHARAVGFRPEIVLTLGPRHLQRLLREQVAEKRPLVAVAGGDGTIHHAIQVLARTEVTLAILPQGTANNFATALHLPRDLPSAFRVLAEGREIRVDLGDADGELFAEAAGAGLFAHFLSITRGRHGILSRLRGLGVLVATFVANRPRRFLLEVDGVPEREEALNVTIANSFAVGHNLPIAPDAKVTDQQLDVVIVGPLSRREMIPYYRALRAQTHTELPKVRTCRARRVIISSRRPRVMHVDDRPVRRQKMNVEVAPAALRVMVTRL